MSSSTSTSETKTTTNPVSSLFSKKSSSDRGTDSNVEDGGQVVRSTVSSMFAKMSSSDRGTGTCSNVEDDGHVRLPILIFPGFMSSGLEVKQSSVGTSATGSMSQKKKSNGWKGKRVWLNMQSAGFESLYFGSALTANEILKANGEDYNEAMHEQYQEENACKNKWIQHLRLADDMRSDLEGIQVRPLEGLKAVDYLVPGGALAKHVSYVFGPVIEALHKVGYRYGHNLDAAPYDWRVPPCILEERDGYFSRTMKRVEEMYHQNGDTPVVLLCHSMGTKTCHYFLNFCLVHPDGGQAWLDRYVHTYMPVGAPHLGAPKSLRGTIDGDKMGLESFLTEEESLIIGRSWGSVPWLYPGRLPLTNAPPNAFLRREGVLHVTVLPFDCEQIFRGKTHPPKIRLSVTFGKQTLHSKFHTPNEAGQFGMNYEETFTFAAPPDLPGSGSADTLRISLQEPMIWRIRKNAFWSKRWDSWLLCWTRCIPCLVVKETSRFVAGAALAGADIVATAAGSTTKLADSDEKDVAEILSKRNPAQFLFNLMHVKDFKKKKTKTVRKARSAGVTVRVRWEPPQHDVDTEKLCDFAVASPSATSPQLRVENGKDKSVIYESVNGVQLLKSECLPYCRAVMTECYDEDPIGPRTLSSEDAPPVKRVKAVYGINLATEVGAVYRRRDIIQQQDKVQKRHKLDASARLIASDGYKIEGGSILETEKTPQLLADSGQVVHCSGDGTVPYWSLQHCRSWQGKCDVTVDEIEHAEHREILADERFHKVLIDYVLPNASSVE